MQDTYQRTESTGTISATDTPIRKAKIYLVGGGIASLASAVYLIRDGHISGKNIYLFEESDRIGGCLDAQGSAERGYTMRGGRMFSEEAYACTFDLLSSIPSLHDETISVKDEIFSFNKKFKSDSKCRLVANGKKVDITSLGLNWQDKLNLIKFMLYPENSLGNSQIKDYFSPSFFHTHFWFEWCTTFAFEPWHSAIEFKRYALRFIQEFPRINTLAGVRRTPYNQYETIILPLVEWLKKQGVHFAMNCAVDSLAFKPAESEKTVERIYYSCDGKQNEIVVDKHDHVIVTIGSMVANSSLGSMTSPAQLELNQPDCAWNLWENIAKNQSDLGRPSVFNKRIDESKWKSFTITFRDPTFFRMMEEFSGNEPGTGGLVTFIDSNWLMSVVLYHQPHFINQPENVYVCWGYGLYPDRKGNFIQKNMSECSGEEILIELCSQLRFDEALPLILSTSTCIPCMMPFVTSQFLTRKQGDRPPVIPKGSTNFALIGQYCEIPDDVVFTVDYSVRSAQIAVYSLLKLNKKVIAPYKGQYNVRVLFNAIKAMLK